MEELLKGLGFESKETDKGQIIWRIPGNFRKIVSYPKDGGNIRVYNEQLQFKGLTVSDEDLLKYLGL